MRFVLDTNVVVAGLLYRGAPNRLLDAAIDGKVLCYSSDALTLELARVLQYSRLARRIAKLGFSKEALAERYAQLVEIVPAPVIVGAVPTDPDDDAVIACAVAAKATHIVSGDKDLLILRSFRDITILSPADAMLAIESA